MATVRRHVRIARPPGDVWALVGDPRRLAEWFPGIVSATVDGGTRWVELASGLRMEERLVTVDGLQHRFQYRIVGGGLITSHLATVDVLDVDGGSVVVYGTDVEPAAFAPVLGGATGAALETLRRLLEER